MLPNMTGVRAGTYLWYGDDVMPGLSSLWQIKTDKKITPKTQPKEGRVGRDEKGQLIYIYISDVVYI